MSIWVLLLQPQHCYNNSSSSVLLQLQEHCHSSTCLQHCYSCSCSAIPRDPQSRAIPYAISRGRRLPGYSVTPPGTLRQPGWPEACKPKRLACGHSSAEKSPQLSESPGDPCGASGHSGTPPRTARRPGWPGACKSKRISMRTQLRRKACSAPRAPRRPLRGARGKSGKGGKGQRGKTGKGGNRGTGVVKGENWKTGEPETSLGSEPATRPGARDTKRFSIGTQLHRIISSAPAGVPPAPAGSPGAPLYLNGSPRDPTRPPTAPRPAWSS